MASSIKDRGSYALQHTHHSFSVDRNITAAPAFISVTNLVNDNGSISADVAVTCAPSPGLYIVILQVTDGEALTRTGALRVNVTEAALSYLSPAPVSFNSARVVTPVAPPEGIASFSVDAPNFRGDISVDQMTGVVTISRARTTGSYTVTVTATNFCGVALTRSFTLIVANGNTEYQGAVGEPVTPSAPEQGSKGSILIFNLYKSGLRNPPDGNRGIVKVQPMQQAKLPRIPPMEIGGSLKSNLSCVEV